MDNQEAILGIKTSIGKVNDEIAAAERHMETFVQLAEMYPDNSDYFESVIEQQEKINA